jgi:hypothetical protein
MTPREAEPLSRAIPSRPSASWGDRVAPLAAISARILPYALSWTVLAVLMVVGMNRLPFGLYGPIDGDWAKWNAEAILHFSKIFDLSPYNMLAGMGSLYLPNLPWLNPGALALALPLSGNAQNIASYAIYAAELAASIVLLARMIGFSWLMATAAAQLYLYLMFPPFWEVFQIYPQYMLAPYYAHLTAVLNAATAVLLACGRTGGWRRNVALCIAFLILFVSGLLSAPISFIFAAPAYIAVAAIVMLARRPPRAEWAWKAAALLLCLIFFFASGLPSYYLGTAATAARTPGTPITWEKILSLGAWLQLFKTHPLCQDSRFLLCPSAKGAWVEISALVGAAIAIATRRGDMRSAAAAVIAYVGFAHLYAYAYQVGWLGSVAVFSPHFLMLSCWMFICMFAVVPFFELFRSIKVAHAGTAGPTSCTFRGKYRFSRSVASNRGELVAGPLRARALSTFSASRWCCSHRDRGGDTASAARLHKQRARDLRLGQSRMAPRRCPVGISNLGAGSSVLWDACRGLPSTGCVAGAISARADRDRRRKAVSRLCRHDLGGRSRGRRQPSRRAHPRNGPDQILSQSFR